MKYFKLGLIVLYVYFILTKTVIGRPVQPEPIFKGLFWELQQGYWNDIKLNILLFIPLGFLIGGWKGILIGFMLSCGIELVQYFDRLGYCELDDVLHNTIGAGIGVGLFSLCHKVYTLIVGKKKSRGNKR